MDSFTPKEWFDYYATLRDDELDEMARARNVDLSGRTLHNGCGYTGYMKPHLVTRLSQSRGYTPSKNELEKMLERDWSIYLEAEELARADERRKRDERARASCERRWLQAAAEAKAAGEREDVPSSSTSELFGGDWVTAAPTKRKQGRQVRDLDRMRGSGSDGARVQGRHYHHRYSQAQVALRQAEVARSERERREREDAAAARARAQERREVANAQRLMAEDQSADVATPPSGPGMCNAGAVARAAAEAREIAEVDALAQRLNAARVVDDGEDASLALAHRLMAEDAAALENARGATDPRPPGLAAPPPVPPPAPAVAAPPPAPRPPPRPAPAVSVPPSAPAVAAPPPAPRPPPRPAPTIAAPAPAATQAARPEPPDALVCPISMELMRDPVMAMDGHTYERGNIERWLADHQTSPKTNEPLPSLTLVPNHAVKSMVQDYLEAANG